MIRCNDCNHLFTDEDVIVTEEDPSPGGIALPHGTYSEWHCPCCGSDDLNESFSLLDNVEEGDEDDMVVIRFGKSTLSVYVSDGKLIAERI